MSDPKKISARRRPRLKTELIRLRTTPEEKQSIVSAADALGMDVAEYILEATSRLSSRISKTDPQLLLHLIKIGNNLNQIARTCQAAAKDGQTIELLQVLVSLEEIKKLVGAYALPR